MNWLIALPLAAAALALALAAYVRLAPLDAESIHVDPMTVGEASGNAAYAGGPDGPVLAAAPEVVFDTLARIIRDTPRVREVAAGPDPFHATFVARTPLMGYPDIVSVKVVAAEGGARYAIFSRARFGTSDLGVNARRVEEWLSALEAELGGS